MRFGAVILILAALAVALTHLRRQEVLLRHEIQQLQSRQVQLRRKLWDQQVRLGYLTAPDRMQRRLQELSQGAADSAEKLAHNNTSPQ